MHGLADAGLAGFRFIGLGAVEIGFHRGVVEFDGGLDEGHAVFLGLVEKVGGNLFIRELGAERLFEPDDSLHADEIDDALEVRLGTDRQLDRDGACAETNLDVFEAAVEIGAGLVHLVAEDDAGNAILVALAPHGLGLGLDALVRVENADRTVEHTQRTLDFNGEVDVAGGVDDVQAPVCSRSRSSQPT